MDKTKIDWCDMSWNPITGCRHNCPYCYARQMVQRFGCGDGSDSEVFVLDSPYKEKDINCETGETGETGETVYGKIEPYPYGFSPTLHRYRLGEPERKKRTRNIFVGSMADLFGAWVPDTWIDEVMTACEAALQHNYLFLTKNVERYIEYGVPMAENMWYGTSVTKEADTHLFNLLPAFCNIFVSIEPILEDLQVEKCNIMFRQVDWFIIGAETGRRKNKVIPERKWIEDIVNECRKNDKPVFMKSSLADIWGEPLIREFPAQLNHKN